MNAAAIASTSGAEDRLAIFLPSLVGGGAERVMLNLAAGLIECGVRVDLLVSQTEGAFREQVPRGVHLISLGASRVLTSLPALTLYLRSARPSAMLTAMDHANLVGLLARRLAGVPVRTVVSVHVAFSDAFLRSQGCRGRWLMRFAGWAYPWADAVVAVSAGVASDLMQKIRVPPQIIRVIHNPILFPSLPALAAVKLSHPWFAPGQPPVVLGVGRLTAQKDFGTLIRAVAAVRAARPARLVILGEGEDRAALEAQVRDSGLAADVEMPGFVENPFAYMRRAAVVVLSSRYEGFGNVLVEAMACGTPVVSCDCPSGPAEILAGGRYGRLVPVSDPLALADAIAATLDRPPEREMLLQRAAEFHVDVATRSYLDVLQLQLSGRAGQ
jgi:glycosyltransferase involved in cell wall biosynthesis